MTPEQYVVSEDVAIEDFEKWLGIKRVSNLKREDLRDKEAYIIEDIRTGILEVGEDGVITQKLRFPLQNTTELTIRPRVLARDVQMAFRTVKDNDPIGRLTALAAKVSSVNNSKVWAQFDWDDLNTTLRILEYFL